MYKSRYHFSNGQVSMAVDSLCGDLLEFNNLAAGENYLKNGCFTLPQPFALTLMEPETVLFPPSSRQVKRDMKLKCEISGDETGFSVRYPYLTDGENVYPADVQYRVRFEGAKTVWNIEVRNVSGRTVKEVKFPCLNGIWLGETWTDDTLVYPMSAGMKWGNPVDFLSRPRKTIQWRWQEYRYVYMVDGICDKQEKNGTYEVRRDYPGGLSMSWMDYYDANGGIYIASHDSEPRTTALIASTYGNDSPGMHFAIANGIHLPDGETWASPDRVVALHAGDWHDGAELYAAYKRPLLTTLPHPAWFDRSAGLMAHYDFKYQNQQVVHRYEDIPRLRAEAREYGLDHILLSGWHQHGFDNGFPLYHADAEMGTEEELKQGMQPEEDMHVSLYVNAFLSNTAYDDVEESVAREPSGEAQLRKFGDDALTFGLMCPGSAAWRGRMAGLARHIENDWGGGVYFDMLSAFPKHCFSSEHGHAHDAVCAEVKKMLASAASGNNCLMGEHVSDEFGGMISGQLHQTFFNIMIGTFSELYRYTFPEHILIDMLYPGRNLAMRPVFVAQKSAWLMHNLFVNGIYYWIYDLVDDNTFSRDPEGAEKLKAMIRLRTFWLQRFGQGRFLDDKPLTDLPENCMVRAYRMKDGWLVACANATGKTQTVRLTAENLTGSATLYTPDDLTGRLMPACDGLIHLPADEFSLIYLPANR